MYNHAVALMRRPAVRRRLRAELAALPHQLVSYEDLLAFFIDWGNDVACRLSEGGRGASFHPPDIRTASRHTIELLLQLAPNRPSLRYRGAAMNSCLEPVDRTSAAAARTGYLTMLPAALDVARQQGSDYWTVICSYQMAGNIEIWVDESAVRQGIPPPSAVLGWLLEAEAAHRRCKALLPKQWTADVDGKRPLAALAKDSLQRLQQQGDRWRRLTPAARQDLAAARQDYEDGQEEAYAERVTCSGCGSFAPQLRRCGACREAWYCR